MAAEWIEKQAFDLEEDAVGVQMFAELDADVFERMAFYAEMQVKSLHRIECLQYAKAGVPMGDDE